MSVRFLSILSLFVLASCANLMEKQYQNIAFETPGAQEAICYVEIDRIRYKVSPPQTLNVSKAKGDMFVDCLAPGNRRQKQVIKPVFSNYTYGNVVTGILPGLAWDYFSDSTHKYPDRVVIDFTYAHTAPEEMPAQNLPDIKQPEEYPLEEILPGRPRLNSDRYEQPFELVPRDKGSAAVQTKEEMHMIENGGTSRDKGDLMRAVNPAGPQSSAKPETSGPVQLIPGQ